MPNLVNYMLKLITLLLFIFIIPFVLAENIDISHPASVKVNENFAVLLKLTDFPADTYDVKIDINPEDRIAQIQSAGAWKSTFYYLNDILQANQAGEFKLKIIKDYQGQANMEIKIKNSGEKIFAFGNYTINVAGKLEAATEQPEQLTEQPPAQQEEIVEQPEVSSNKETTQKPTKNSNEDNPDAIIQTTAQAIKTNPVETIRLENEKSPKTTSTASYLPYLFITSISLLALYLVIRRLKH